MEIPYIV
jgi:hypothetical protein